MNPFKELRTRWMYWRYRNITLRRQRWNARRAARSPRAAFGGANTIRGVRANPWPSSRRIARTWITLVVTAVAIAIVHTYSASPSITFLANIGILVVAYLVWLQVAKY